MGGDKVTLITAIVGAVCGVAGAILGVINTWQQLRRDKVRLKIIPKHVIPFGGLENAQVNFGIEVINLSEFPIVIEDAGFLLTNGQHGTLATVPGIESNGKLPLRLEPRSSYSKFFYCNRETINWSDVSKAYARTQCGTEATGTSGALEQLIRESGKDDR